MTDPFARLIGPLIQHLLEFQRGLARGEHPDLDPERRELLALLDEAEQRAASSAGLADDYALARYALIYWIDEILINSTWAHASEWREHILEWDYFRERLGGEQFYRKASEAEARAGTDALEAFFLCVALGFRGQYSHEPRALQSWADRVYRRIAEGSRHPDRFLPDEPRDPDEGPLRPLPGPSILLMVCVLVSASLVVSLASFILAAHLTG